MVDRYRTVLAALNAGVVVHAPDTTILEANERARRLLGIRDLDGRPATDPAWVFLEPDGSPMTLEHFPVMRVLASRAPVVDQRVIVRRPEGREIWVEVNALPRLDEAGGLIEVVVTFIDITDAVLERRAAADLNRRLSELSVTDDLTGIANRRGIFKSLHRENIAAKRHRQPLALLVLDLDHFKRVNDEHGHAVGDEVLRQVAAILRSEVRTGDLIGRIGGEEFMVVLPQTDTEGALALADRIRHAISEHEPLLGVTVSAGLACAQPGDDVGSLFRRSDDALYEAKESGRDCVVLAE